MLASTGNRRSAPRSLVTVEPITDMPPGTLGFRMSGTLTRRDYAEVLVPTLQAKINAGERLHVLYLIGPELQMEPGAVWEDVKTGIDLGLIHRDQWERNAVLTDLEWLRKSLQLFSWMIPGETRLFHEAETEQAKAWLGGQSA